MSEDIIEPSAAVNWRPGKARTNVRVLSHYVSLQAIVLRVVEFIILAGALIGAQWLRLEEFKDLVWIHAPVYGAVCVVALQALELYSRRQLTSADLLVRLSVGYGGAIVALVLLYYFIPPLTNGRSILGIAVVLSMPVSFGLRKFLYAFSLIAFTKNRIMVIGEGSLSDDDIRVANRSDDGAELVGTYHPLTRTLHRSEGTKSGPFSLQQAARQVAATEVVVASREERGGGLPMQDLLLCKMAGVAVTDAISYIEREEKLLKVDAMRLSWLLFHEGFGHGKIEDMAKRLLDIVVSLTILMISLPIGLLAAVAILVETGAPLFYSQERVGLGGRVFKVWKFRSMTVNAESGTPQWAKKNDSRVTRVGRFIRMTRIDELPQLFNVLRGEMSFVGPRPERPFFVEQLRLEVPYYDLRHIAKPGLTGWSQVRYPYGASKEDALNKLQYDLYYVKNRSVLLDLVVIVATIHTILFARGAR